MSKTAATLLKGQEVGHYITEELSELLMKHTGGAERSAAAYKSGVGIYTITSLIQRKNLITEGNYPGLVEVVKETIKKIDEAKVDAEVLQTLLV